MVKPISEGRRDSDVSRRAGDTSHPARHTATASALRRGPLLRGIGVAGLVAAMTFATTVANAANESGAKAKPRITHVDPVGHWAYTRLSRAHDALSAEKYDDALAELADMKKGAENLNGHERALMWQTFGYVQAAQGKQEEAATSFENCLEENALPEQSQLSTLSNLAQIELMLGRYDKAIVNFEELFRETPAPSPQQYYLLALAYAQTGDEDKAIPYAEHAVAKAVTPNEGQLQLLSALYFRKERYEDLIPILRQLVERFPKKAYWIQLSAIYAELGRPQEALGAQEAVYEQGMINQNREYVTLARLYLQNDVPFEATKVLEDGFGKGEVESNAQTWQLLASSYMQAREYDKAVGPLKRAAELGDTGDGYVRLGELHLNRYRFSDARRAFQSAMKKGGLEDRALVELLYGIACAGEGRYEEAKQAFAVAERSEEHAKLAKQWIEHVDREESFAAAGTKADASAIEESRAAGQDGAQVAEAAQAAFATTHRRGASSVDAEAASAEQAAARQATSKPVAAPGTS
jgi:tetratricopeptide (TPR) repeat protein